MAKRLIAADIDGTLVTRDQRILPCVREAAERLAQAGHTLALCTGRAIGECWYVLEALPMVRYAVTQTGAMVQDLKTGALLFHCPLSVEDARIIYGRLRRYDALINVFSDGVVYNAKSQIENFSHFFPMEFFKLYERSHVFVDDLDAMMAGWQKPVEKLYAPFVREDECRQAHAELSGLPYFVTGAGFNDLEAMNPQAGKGRALAALAAHLGFTREDVLAIGDSSNDAAMLDYAGVGVAMGNAEASLKAIADEIAPSNEDGGVAWVLNRVLGGSL